MTLDSWNTHLEFNPNRLVSENLDTSSNSTSQLLVLSISIRMWIPMDIFRNVKNSSINMSIAQYWRMLRNHRKTPILKTSKNHDKSSILRSCSTKQKIETKNRILNPETNNLQTIILSPVFKRNKKKETQQKQKENKTKKATNKKKRNCFLLHPFPPSADWTTSRSLDVENLRQLAG